MPPDVPPPTQVLTLVFGAWAAGTIVGGWVSRLSGEIQPGHFKVVWLASAGLSTAAGFGYHRAWVVAGLSLATFFAVYRGRDRELGFVTAAAAITALAAGAGPRLFALATAALLGAVTNAMLLGHWHLNQPRLGTRPILRLVWAVWGALSLYAAAIVLLTASAEGVALLGAVTALGFTVFAAVLTAMVHHLVRTRSIMSATGILYLEILLAVVAAFTGSLGALARV